MFDEIDLKILSRLQENGRIKRSELSAEVGLSLPSLSDRIKKLEAKGVIEGYYAKINRSAFGYDLMALISVIMDSSKNYKKLITHVNKHAEIIECYAVLGEGSHILKVLVKDRAALEKLLAKIQSWTGVTRTVTSFILSTIKETNNLKINTNEGNNGKSKN